MKKHVVYDVNASEVLINVWGEGMPALGKALVR